MFSCRGLQGFGRTCQILPMGLCSCILFLYKNDNCSYCSFLGQVVSGVKIFSPRRRKTNSCSVRFFQTDPKKVGETCSPRPKTNIPNSPYKSRTYVPHDTEQSTNIMYTTSPDNKLHQLLTSDTFCDILTLGQLGIVCSMLHHRVYPLTRAG